MIIPPPFSIAVVLLFSLPLLALGDNDTAADSDATLAKQKTLLYVLYFAYQLFYKINKNARIIRLPPIQRERRHVNDLFDELGPYYLKRAYRMERSDFWALHKIIYSKMKYKIVAPDNKGVPGVPQTNGAPNGIIPSSLRLSAAIRYFAGGSVYDIALSHGIGIKDVYKSAWRVVDAINQTKKLNIVFPETKEEQKRLLLIAKEQSKAGFNVVGFTDRMLV